MSGSGRNYKPSPLPRRPCSAYAYFVQDNYRLYARQTGVRDAVTLFPILYQQWRDCDDKEAYNQRAMRDKKRYQSEMMQYAEMVKNGILQPAPIKQRRTKQEGYPRMPKNAFVFFSNEVRDQVRRENPTMNYRGIMKELGRRWSALKKSDKRKYRIMRDQDRVRFANSRRQFEERKKWKRLLESRRKDKERLYRLAGKIQAFPTPAEQPPQSSMID